MLAVTIQRTFRRSTRTRQFADIELDDLRSADAGHVERGPGTRELAMKVHKFGTALANKLDRRTAIWMIRDDQVFGSLWPLCVKLPAAAFGRRGGFLSG